MNLHIEPHRRNTTTDGDARKWRGRRRERPDSLGGLRSAKQRFVIAGHRDPAGCGKVLGGYGRGYGKESENWQQSKVFHAKPPTT